MSGSPASSPPLPAVAVGGIAVRRNMLLMVQRARPPGAGRWSVPGGRVEPGESVTEAVERELHEETALEVRCGDLLGWAERRGADYHYVILDFEVTTDSTVPPVAGSDARVAAWVPLADVTTLPLVAGLEDFLVAHGVLG